MNTYYIFNKPRGCVSARRDALHMTVMDYFPDYMKNSFSPVGRLDIDTVGLLIVTDDGKFIHKMTDPQFEKEKEYYFWAFGNPDTEKIKGLENGTVLPGKGIITRPCKLEILERSKVKFAQEYMDPKLRAGFMKNPEGNVFCGKIIIHEGKKHQVKRMIKTLGCHIFYLKRMREGKIVLPDDLPEGAYIKFTQ